MTVVFINTSTVRSRRKPPDSVIASLGLSNDQEFGAHTLETGTFILTISATGYSNASDYGAHTVETGIFYQTLTLTGFSDAQAFGALALEHVGSSPSYDNEGGKGDRTALITVTYTGPVLTGLAPNLVDGNLTGDATHAVKTADVGPAYFVFDFGVNKIINEIKWINSAGSDNRKAYFVIDGYEGGQWYTIAPVEGVLLAPNAETIIPFVNTKGYTQYRIGIPSSDTSWGSTALWMTETEFKIMSGTGTLVAYDYSWQFGAGNRTSIITVTSNFGTDDPNNLVSAKLDGVNMGP